MAKCANRNTAEYKALKKRFKTNIDTDNIINTFQTINNTEDIPSVTDALKTRRDRKVMLAAEKKDFISALESNITGTRKASKLKGVIYANNTIKGTRTSNKGIAKRNAIAIITMLQKNNIPTGVGQLVEVQETDKTFKFVINDNLFRPQDALPASMDKMSGNTKAILAHLDRIFPDLKINNLSRKEAKEIYDSIDAKYKSKAKWEDVKSFYFKGQAYVIGSRIAGDVAIEEVLHPVIDSIYLDNPALFNGLLKEAKLNFVELNQQILDAYTEEKGFTERERNLELVTQALVRHFRQEYENKPTKSFMDKIKELLEWFKNVIKDLNLFVTNRTLRAGNIKDTATLSDIAKLLNTSGMQFKFETRRTGKIRYSLNEDAEKAYKKAIEESIEGPQREMAKRMLNVARSSTKTETDLSVSKNSEFFDSSNFVVRDDSDHTYHDVETGGEYLSATKAMKGALLNEEEVALNLAIGQDFDAILNGIAAGISLEELQGKMNELSSDLVQKIYVDLQTHLDSIKGDGGIVLPQVVLYDDQEIAGEVLDKDGKLQKVTYQGLAGTADLLVITPAGEIKIIDLKTSMHYLKTDPAYYDKPFTLASDSLLRQKTDSTDLSTRAQHNLQIALYRRMLENMGYTMATRGALSTFHIKVGINKDKQGNKTFDGTYDIEGIQYHRDSEMEGKVDALIPSKITNEQKARIDEERKNSGQYNPVQDEDFLDAEEKQPENNDSQTEVDIYLQALENFQLDLLKRREALEKIKGGVSLDKSKQATIESINETISNIEIASTNGPDAVKAEYTRVIQQAIKDVKEYTNYILDPNNVKDPTYINYLLNFDRYSQTFRSLIELGTMENTPLSKTQANLVLALQGRLRKLKGNSTTTGLIDASIFNFVKETVRSVSSAEFNDADLEQILTQVRDIGVIEYQTGDLATSRDTLLATLDKIYKAKAQEYLDKAQARELIIRNYANTLAKLDPGTKPQDLYNYMVEFDEKGLPTGFIVQRLGQQYYDMISEIRKKAYDEDGNKKVYLEIDNTEEGSAAELKYNKDLWLAKQEAARFWTAERADDQDNIIDGNFHRYTEEYKKLRAKYESPTVTEGGAVIWKKKRTVNEKAWRNFRNNNGRYIDTYFAQKLNGSPTGVVTPGQMWIPNNKFKVANDSAIIKGKKVSMLNSKYDSIMNHAPGDALGKARKEFYNFYVSTMKELVEKLPPSMSEQMVGRIPTIKSNISNRLKEEGSFFTKAYAKLKRKGSEVFNETGTFRTVVTNEKGDVVNSLPIYFTGSLGKQSDLDAINKKIEGLAELRKQGKVSAKYFNEEQGKLLAQLNRIENKATAETLSLDLGSSLLKFNSMAENYEVMSTIDDIVKAFIKVSEKREVLAEKSKNDMVAKIVGKTKDYFKPVGNKEDQIEKNIKKRIKKWASMVYYDNENVTQNALEKMTNGLMQYSSFAYVATNPMGNINNLIIGRLNNTLELIGAKYYKRKAYLQMTAAFNREQVVLKQIKRTGHILDGKKGVYDPKKPMTKWEGWVDALRMMDSDVEIRETGAVEEGESYIQRAANWFYLLNDSFEYNVQTKQGMAMVASMTAVDEGGNEMNLYDASTFNHTTQKIEVDTKKYKILDRDGNQIEWNTEYKRQFRNNIREVNKRVHGSYARADRMVLQGHFLGKLAIQFKKWVAPLLKNRMRSEYYDENLGWTEGRYRSFAKFMAYSLKNLNQVGNLEKNYREELLKDFKNQAAESIDYGHVDKRVNEKIQNAYQTIGEIGVVFLVFALSSLLDDLLPDEDDDGYIEKRLKNLAKYNVDRAGKELVAFWPGFGTPQAYQLIKNPIASASVLENFAQALWVTFTSGMGAIYYSDEEFAKDKDYVYQRGKNKGKLKAGKEWADILPFLSSIKRFDNLDQNRKFYVD
jgi:hypothetical protein